MGAFICGTSALEAQAVDLSRRLRFVTASEVYGCAATVDSVSPEHVFLRREAMEPTLAVPWSDVLVAWQSPKAKRRRYPTVPVLAIGVGIGVAATLPWAMLLIGANPDGWRETAPLLLSLAGVASLSGIALSAGFYGLVPKPEPTWEPVLLPHAPTRTAATERLIAQLLAGCR